MTGALIGPEAGVGAKVRTPWNAEGAVVGRRLQTDGGRRDSYASVLVQLRWGLPFQRLRY